MDGGGAIPRRLQSLLDSHSSGETPVGRRQDPDSSFGPVAGDRLVKRVFVEVSARLLVFVCLQLMQWCPIRLSCLACFRFRAGGLVAIAPQPLRCVLAVLHKSRHRAHHCGEVLAVWRRGHRCRAARRWRHILRAVRQHPQRAPSLPEALRRLHWAALHAPAAVPAVVPLAVIPIQDWRPGAAGAPVPPLLPLSADDFVGRYGVPAGHPPGADASAHILNHLDAMLPPAAPPPVTPTAALWQKAVREARNAIAGLALPVVFPFPVSINVEKLADAWGRGR